jgi:NhaC family Na+:H+ antiporter
MTIGLAFNMDPVLMGGAILSGVFWGDRCSPVSTSALLVSEVTGTNLYNNIKLMFRTSMVPFALACAIYAVIGIMVPVKGGEVPDVAGMFAGEFRIGIVAVIPAVVILLFAFARVKVMWTMLASIVAAAVVCIVYQGVPFSEVLLCAVAGFEAEDAALATMLDGGGVVSMLKVAGIVCISASYAGIFQKKGLLDGVIGIIG